MKIIATAALALLIATATACSTATNGSAEAETTPAPDILGRWTIESIVLSDTDYVRPAEIVPGAQQFFLFTDSTYSVHTNCNSLSGWYTLSGDTLVLGDGAMTEMACDNMDTEDALRRILPYIATARFDSDTTLRLGTDTPGRYILLRK